MKGSSYCTEGQAVFPQPAQPPGTPPLCNSKHTSSSFTPSEPLCSEHKFRTQVRVLGYLHVGNFKPTVFMRLQCTNLKGIILWFLHKYTSVKATQMKIQNSPGTREGSLPSEHTCPQRGNHCSVIAIDYLPVFFQFI